MMVSTATIWEPNLCIAISGAEPVPGRVYVVDHTQACVGMELVVDRVLWEGGAGIGQRVVGGMLTRGESAT